MSFPELNCHVKAAEREPHMGEEQRGWGGEAGGQSRRRAVYSSALTKMGPTFAHPINMY